MKPIRAFSAFLLLAVFAPVDTGADTYRVSRQSQWDEWKFPKGVLDFVPQGLTLTRYDRNINAALNAAEFTHALAGNNETNGGVWAVGSNARIADRVIDGDATTWWHPNQGDDLEDWWIQVDLGRAVPVTGIRVVFPDEEGARPPRQFRLFASDGERISQGADLFSFEMLGGYVPLQRRDRCRVPAGNAFRNRQPLPPRCHGSTGHHFRDELSLPAVHPPAHR